MTATKPPNNLDEYNARHHQTYKIEGFGVGNIHVHSPCPFCAAPDWCIFELLEMEAVTSEPHVCSECGRGAKLVYSHPSPGTTQFRVVQTEGDDPPKWLTDHFPIQRDKSNVN